MQALAKPISLRLTDGSVLTVMYPTTQYMWGVDRVLAKLEVTTGKSYYYLYNGHGDVVQIVDTSGNIVNQYDYDVWGNFITKQETISNHFTYFGQTYDEATGLYYLRARYYDPTTGRFTQQDIAEDGYNWYIYGNQNPVVFVDESGEGADFAGNYSIISVENIIKIGISVGTLNYLGQEYLKSKIFYAKGKTKAPSPPSKLKDGDKVKTPDSHPNEFKKNKDGSFTHEKSKWNFKKDPSKHGGEHWDASPTGKYGDHINVNPDGTIR